MADLINIGLTGLRSHQTALSVTGNNVANTNTPGYSRQEAIFEDNPSLLNGAGYLGQGVNIDTVRRLTQGFLVEHRTDFMLLGHFMHQRVLQMTGLEQPQQTRPLSAREKDAMRLIARGMSRGRASEKLGISENTFRVYIDSARHKLGALNIPNAIALAVHRGIIPPV